MSFLRAVFTFLLVVFLFPFHPALSPSSLTLRLNDAVSLDLIALPGSPTLWMGRTPVTVGQFRAFVESSGYRTDAESSTGQGPGHVGGHGWDAQRHRFDGWWPQYTWRYTGWPLTDEHPASNISWNDASAFCKWLSEKSGRRIRLPANTEWERAERAGTTTVYFTGDSPASLEGYANVADALCCELSETPSTPREVFPSTTDTHSRRPLASSNRIPGDFTICSETSLNGALQGLVRRRVAVHITMVRICVVIQHVAGARKSIADMPISGSA
jgi:Sulfatase-modifying factor enzyme 1